MLASSLLAKPPRSSSSIHFVPPQVMLQQSGAVMNKVEGMESAKEKKERKKRSSETSQLDKRIVGGVPSEGLGRDVLLRSIAAFLDSNGLSKTLSVLLSEAQLEMGCWESSSVNLEDLFGKLSDPSNYDAEQSFNWLRDQVSKKASILEDVTMNHASEKTDKKKRKRAHQVDGNGIETDKSITEKSSQGCNRRERLSIDGVQGKYDGERKVESKLEGLSAKSSDISEKHVNESNKWCKAKRKKHKEVPEIGDVKLAIDGVRGKLNGEKKVGPELEDLSAKISDISERHDGSNEQRKAKKKKHKVPEICDEIAEPRVTGNPKEIVKTNKVKPVALENNSLESNLKEKTEKKKDKKVKCTDPVTVDPLDVNVSTHGFKKKKLKLDSDVVPKMISGQTEEEKSSDNVKEMEINHDVGASDFEHQNVLVSEDRETKGTKKVSKKIKMLDSEKADGKIANKKSKVDSKVEEKAKTGKTVESSRSIMDINTPVPKIRNAGENRNNTENASEQLQSSTKSNENGNTHNSKNVGKQLENGSIGKKGERPLEERYDELVQRSSSASDDAGESEPSVGNMSL